MLQSPQHHPPSSSQPLPDLLAAWQAAEADVAHRYAKFMSAVARKHELERRVAAAMAKLGRGTYEAGGKVFAVTQVQEAGPITQAHLKAVLSELFPGDAKRAEAVADRIVSTRPRKKKIAITCRRLCVASDASRTLSRHDL